MNDLAGLDFTEIERRVQRFDSAFATARRFDAGMAEIEATINRWVAAVNTAGAASPYQWRQSAAIPFDAPGTALAVRPPEPPPAAAAPAAEAAAEIDAAQWREVLSAAIAAGLAEPAAVVALAQSHAEKVKEIEELRQFVSAYQVATGKRGSNAGWAIARRMSMSRATLYRRIAAAKAAGLLT